MKKSHSEHKAERRHKVEEEYKNAQALSGILECEERLISKNVLLRGKDVKTELHFEPV